MKKKPVEPVEGVGIDLSLGRKITDWPTAWRKGLKTFRQMAEGRMDFEPGTWFVGMGYPLEFYLSETGNPYRSHFYDKGWAALYKDQTGTKWMVRADRYADHPETGEEIWQAYIFPLNPPDRSQEFWYDESIQGTMAEEETSFDVVEDAIEGVNPALHWAEHVIMKPGEMMVREWQRGKKRRGKKNPRRAGATRQERNRAMAADIWNKVNALRKMKVPEDIPGRPPPCPRPKDYWGGARKSWRAAWLEAWWDLSDEERRVWLKERKTGPKTSREMRPTFDSRVFPRWKKKYIRALLSGLPHRAKMNPPKEEKALYTAVILDDPRDLEDWWTQYIGPLLPKRYSHHMTIKFKPTPEEVASLPLGAPVALEIVGFAADKKGQAVQVQVVSQHLGSVKSTNPIPHITVATDGTSPVYSNELLSRGVVPAEGFLYGRVGYVSNRGKDVF